VYTLTGLISLKGLRDLLGGPEVIQEIPFRYSIKPLSLKFELEEFGREFETYSQIKVASAPSRHRDLDNLSCLCSNDSLLNQFSANSFAPLFLLYV